MCRRNRIVHLIALSTAGILAFAAAGCGEKHLNEKQVFKIKGTVKVDGNPVPDIQVALHAKAGPDDKQPTYPQGFTDAEGHIRISTYEDGDGAPEGEYNLTFVWQEFNLLSRSYGGPDKLNKKYADPKNSPFNVVLAEGRPNDIGTVELTTKK